MSIKYSIIVPIYNVESYIERSAWSVLNQTYNNFELILIDDGSTDNSLEECVKISEINPRVVVIQKENGGASSARNAGIRAATGDYILFLDADDYWDDTDALLKINNVVKKTQSDIIHFSYKKLFENGRIQEHVFFEEKVAEYEDYYEKIKFLITHDYITCGVWDKAIKRDFIFNNELFFWEGIRSEDVDYVLRMLKYKPSIEYINSSFYVYQQGRDDSVTKNVDEKHCGQILDIIKQFTNDTSIDFMYKELLLNYVSFIYLMLIANVFSLGKSNRKNILKSKIKEYSFLMSYRKNPRVKKAGLIYDLLGLNIMGFLLARYINR